MAYLLVALVASIVGITIVVVRNRPRVSRDSVREFEKGLQALAPRPGQHPDPRPQAEEA